jgi:hypothetical protein
MKIHSVAANAVGKKVGERDVAVHRPMDMSAREKPPLFGTILEGGN